MKFEGRDISIVAGMHGNERAPVRALRARGEAFILGNPPAYEKSVRFIERDLNASFGLTGTSAEEVRAREILEEIPASALVLDFHTTSAKGLPFAILTDKALLPFAGATGLRHAVLMTHNIKEGHALLNYRDGISIEMSGYDSEESYAATAAVCDALAQGKQTELDVFEVYDIIKKAGEYENFVLHADGFYPVLVGEEAYDFVGLKSRKIVQ